jgi:hypothetical protein
MADRIVCQTVVELEEKGKSLLSESHNEYLYRLLPSSLFNYWPVISRILGLTRFFWGGRIASSCD